MGITEIKIHTLSGTLNITYNVYTCMSYSKANDSQSYFLFFHFRTEVSFAETVMFRFYPETGLSGHVQRRPSRQQIYSPWIHLPRVVSTVLVIT